MILIIGATGYIGRYLSSYLNEKGYDVLALGRSAKVKPFFDENGIPFQYFDLNDHSSFDKLPKNIDAIVDLSARIAEHEASVEDFFSLNTMGVYKVLEYAHTHNIKKVIITSSHKVYNDVKGMDGIPISESVYPSFTGDHTPYIISKIAAENFVEYYNKDFGLNSIALRLTGVHGYGELLGHLNSDGSYKKSAFEIFFESAIRGETIYVWGNQNIKRDHIYVKDVVTAIEASINVSNAKGIFNIASGVGYSQYEEALALVKIFSTEKKSEIICCPDKPGLTSGYIYDISKAKRELGWAPKFTSLYDLYDDYKKEWKAKKFHNYHFVLEDQKSLVF